MSEKFSSLKMKVYQKVLIARKSLNGFFIFAESHQILLLLFVSLLISNRTQNINL